jgi:hypothetical protein
MGARAKYPVILTVYIQPTLPHFRGSYNLIRCNYDRNTILQPTSPVFRLCAAVCTKFPNILGALC